MVYPDLGNWNAKQPQEADDVAVRIAEDLAWTAIEQLTAGRVSFEPVTIRPMQVEGDATFLIPAGNGGIKEIRVDGVPITDWRLDDNNRVQPLGDRTFEANADLTQDADEVGVTEIDYYPGWRPGRLLIWAAAELANEFYLAASGSKKCRLPNNVTAITRQGVSYELSKPYFDDGRTGIHEIDIVLERYNPAGLRTVPVIASVESIARTRRVG